jgi:adenylate cyclase
LLPCSTPLVTVCVKRQDSERRSAPISVVESETSVSEKRDKRQRDGRLILLLLLALAVPITSEVLALWKLARVRGLELLIYDVHCRSLPRLKPDPRIVIVGMDDATLDRLSALERHSYPLPRNYHGRVVDTLHDAGARVIGFDVWFTDRAPREEDALFAAAMKRHGKVVAGLKSDTEAVDGDERILFTPSAPLLRPYILPGALLMQRSFGDEIRWFLPYPADSHTTRRYPLLAVALAASYFGEADREPLIRDTFRLGPINAPIGERGEILIRYAGPAGTFTYVPYHEVYNGTWKKRRGEDYFRGKIALIGRISEIEDRQQTPLYDMQGVEVVANATQTLLQGRYIRHTPAYVNFLIKLCLCVALALVVWKMGLGLGLALALVEMAAWVVTSNRLFVSRLLWVDLVEPVGTLALTFVAMALYEIVRIRRVFYRFVPSQVASQMLRSPENASARTAEREVTVVFCDIRRYTEMSETLPAEAVESILHAYFTAGEKAAQELNTELDKFVGDEIMLFFEGKTREGSHALRAVRWALTMQDFARRQDQSGVTGKIGFRIGVGISSGKVRVGTVGAEKRIQGTVIGDAVNVAARLQEATKTVGRPILISRSTYDSIEFQVDAELLGEITVKGKQEPLTVYYPRKIVA